MASETLQELLVLIEASTQGLREELNKGVGDVTSFEKKVEASVDKIDSRFTKLGRTLRTALGAFGISVGVAGIVRFAQGSVTAAADIGKVARAADVSAKTLQELRHAFRELAGVTDQQTDTSLTRFNRTVGQAAVIGSAAERSFAALDVQVRDTGGALRGTETILEETLRKLAAIPNDARRAAAASKLFGDEAGPKLAGALGTGIEAIEKSRNAMRGFTDQAVRDAELMQERLGRLGRTWGSVFTDAFVAFTADAAEFFGMIDRESAEMEKFGEAGARVFARMREITEQIENLRAATPAGSSALSGIVGDLQAQHARLERLAAVGITPFAERRRLLDPNRPQRPRDFTAADLPRAIPTFPNAQLDSVENAFAERRQRLEQDLNALEQRSLRAQGRMEEAIRLSADQQIAQWQRVAEETPEYADQAARAIVLINERATAEIKTLGEKAQTKMKEFAAAFVATFESRGIEALFSGKLRNAVRGFTKDLAELIIRMTILKPLAEAIANSLSKIGKDDQSDTTSNIIDGLLGFSGGGRPPMGRASLVGEHGPELWVPDTPGRIISNAQSQRLAMAGGGGINVRVEQHLQVGLPPQWHAQMAAGAQVAAKTARDAVMKELGGRR